MTKWTTIFLLSLSNILLGQINKKFIIAVGIDNIRSIELKNNKTYRYTNWSGFMDTKHTLDSGTYEMIKKQITFHSLTNNKSAFDGQVYYLDKLRLKNKQTTTYIHSEKKFLRRKVFILHKGSR